MHGPVSKLPAVAGQVLMKGDGDGAAIEAQAKMYSSVTATCMYMLWFRLDILMHVQTT
jgi:hypothetical protein